VRARKWLGYGLLGLLTVLGSGLAYTARPPYEPPQARAMLKAEFVPTVARRVGEQSVIVFVFDGLAPSTLRGASAPNLARMAREGAHTLDMMPVFPSLSMPNHFSLSTGCYPARHGVVSNFFRDPERGIYTELGDADWLLDCEPLHVVAERQGVRAAVFASVAGISASKGKLATLVEPYGPSAHDARAQADRIIAQLERPAAERPGLITAYVNEPDHTSHRYGPTAARTLEVTHDIDAQVGRVMDAIERLSLRDRVTLIVTTDHGMVAADKLVSIERLLRMANVDALVLADGSIGHVYLKDPRHKRAALSALSGHGFFDVIDPGAPPEYARMGRSARVGDLIVSMHPGYMTFDAGHWPWYLRFFTFIGSGISDSPRLKAMHGYNPEAVPEVRAIFYAWGHKVRAGLVLRNVRTVDVQPSVAALLGIEPGVPNDGQARLELVDERRSEH
jgi:predicted AlkP superfamily pyrophosphatase or phosphodiesterase